MVYFHSNKMLIKRNHRTQHNDDVMPFSFGAGLCPVFFFALQTSRHGSSGPFIFISWLFVPGFKIHESVRFTRRAELNEKQTRLINLRYKSKKKNRIREKTRLREFTLIYIVVNYELNLLLNASPMRFFFFCLILYAASRSGSCHRLARCTGRGDRRGSVEEPNCRR